MPEMIRGLLVIALLSCGSRSHPPTSQPGPPARTAAQPTDAASPPPPPADAASPPADAAAAAPAAGGPLYFYGKPLPAGHDDRYTCRATDVQIHTCNGKCMLMPPVKYWDGELECSGVQRPPPDLREQKKRLDALAIPACQCSCDAGYKAASDAYHKEIERCAAVP